MARICLLTALVAAVFAVPSTQAQDAAPAEAPVAVILPLPQVVMHTALGDITIELDTAHAPLTAQNFLRYVDAKRFDGITIYRAVKIGDEGKYGLVQGGLRGDRKRAFPPVAHESPATTKLSHLDATISMAREEPGSATGDFFFIVGDLVALDGAPDKDDPGYAVFGRVTAGMDVVRAVLELPRSETADQESMKGQILAAPVAITTTRRVSVEGATPP
jgi:peptidyl-prolyl cis-trans isomerase A (cyclophilin A)